ETLEIFSYRVARSRGGLARNSSLRWRPGTCTAVLREHRDRFLVERCYGRCAIPAAEGGEAADGGPAASGRAGPGRHSAARASGPTVRLPDPGAPARHRPGRLPDPGPVPRQAGGRFPARTSGILRLPGGLELGGAGRL